MELIFLIIVVVLVLFHNSKKRNEAFECLLTKRLFKINLFLNLILLIGHILINFIFEYSDKILELCLWTLLIYIMIFVWANILIVFPVFLFEYFKNKTKIK